MTEIEVMASDYAASWCSLDPDEVAAHYAPDGTLVINGGELLSGRGAIRAVVSEFYANFPDLEIACDDVRVAGRHAIFVWTLTGHHEVTRNRVRIRGWVDWDLTDHLLIQRSLGWFDAADYQRQIDGR